MGCNNTKLSVDIIKADPFVHRYRVYIYTTHCHSTNILKTLVVVLLYDFFICDPILILYLHYVVAGSSLSASEVWRAVSLIRVL